MIPAKPCNKIAKEITDEFFDVATLNHAYLYRLIMRSLEKEREAAIYYAKTDREMVRKGGVMEHTPGPWKVFEWGTPLNLAVVVEMPDNFWIACRDDVDFGDVEADAHLIATAPDLLAALEAVEWVSDGLTWLLCPWCRGVKDGQFDYDFRAMGYRIGHAPDCQRQAALAKARGE